MDLRIKQSQEIVLKQKQKLVTKIRIAALMKLPDNTFGSFVKEVENDPIFKKLLSQENKDRQVVCYRRFPGTSCVQNLYEFKEEINRDKAGFDVETLINNHKKIMSLIKGMGQEKFEKYFLYNEECLAPKEISASCGVSESEVKEIVGIIDELSVHAEFFHPSEIQFESQVTYYKVATLEEDGMGEFLIRFFSPRFTRGKYVIDYEKLNALKKQDGFSSEELARLGRVIKNLEMINARKSTLYQILRCVAIKQSAYLKSGNEKDLIPYTQKELSRGMQIDESLVSRAIYSKSIETPQHAEKPLQFFFPSKKDVRKRIIRMVLETEKKPLTDRELTDLLKNKFSITISRRTVNACRLELQREGTL